MLPLVLITEIPYSYLITRILNRITNPLYTILFTIESGSFNGTYKETIGYFFSDLIPCLGTWLPGLGFLRGSSSFNRFLN